MKMKRFVIVLMLASVLCGLLLPSEVSAEETDVTRDTVLVLDISGSMGGDSLRALKVAALKFCEAVLAEASVNQVAIVSYSWDGNIVCDFTDDIDILEGAINSFTAVGSTNISEPIELADSLLQASSAAKKNIVLMTDGIPNEGEVSYNGPYSFNDYYACEYANAVYESAVALHGSYKIYTLGFFHSLLNSEKDFATRFLRDIQNAGYFEVEDPAELEFRFGELAEEITAERIETQFTYLSGNLNYTETCYYEDAFFSGSAMDYNPSLATASMSLAMAGFSSGGDSEENPYANNSENVEALLTDLKFDPESIQVNEDFNLPSKTNGIGVAAAMKELPGDVTLLAVVVRGGGYEREWGGNFLMGESGLHDGFNTASTEVMRFLQSYAEDKEFHSTVKVWVVGYSRGAAAANLTAAAMNNGRRIRDDIALSKENIFAYCFETPAGTTDYNAQDPTLYGNIHNVINPNDIVPMLAPRALGFKRYGSDYYLPCAAKNSDYSVRKSAMLDQYYRLPSVSRYLVEDFQRKKVQVTSNMSSLGSGSKLPFNIAIIDDTSVTCEMMGVMLQDYIDKLFNSYISRDKYYNKLQDGIVAAVDTLISNVVELSAVGETMWKKLDGNKMSLFVRYLFDEHGAYEELAEYFLDSFEENGGKVSDREALLHAAGPLLDCMLAFGLNNLSDTATFASNTNVIISAHYPELALAWLRSEDPIYAENALPQTETAEYRIIRINCPVDVCVKNADGTRTLAQFIGDETQKIENGLISYINDNGEKLVVLPADAEYTLDIQATETTEVTFSINERSFAEAGTKRTVNYYAIPMEKNEVLTATAPAYSVEELSQPNEASSTDYTLINSSGEVLRPDEDLRGTVANTICRVEVQTSDPALGAVWGESICTRGSFAQVEAATKENATFEGWYNGETQVSKDLSYRFCVKEDILLTAHFKRIEPNETQQPTQATEPTQVERPADDADAGISSSQIALLIVAGLAVIAFAVLLGGLFTRKPTTDDNEEVLPYENTDADEYDDEEKQAVWPRTPMLKAAPANRCQEPRIKVLSGAMEGMAFPIQAGETIRIGRSPAESEIVIGRSYSRVSRMHCMVTYSVEDNAYVVVDCSSGGTFYQNRVRLVKGYRTPIRRGTKLLLADTQCIILLE